MKTRHKVLIGLAIAWAILVAGGMIAVLIFVKVLSMDEPPPDDRDLIVHRLDIPDDQNGFTYFKQAGEVLYWPGTKAWKESGKHPEPENGYSDSDDPQVKAALGIRDRLDNMVEGKGWDEALAAEILDANQETFALMEKGRGCNRFQVPKPEGYDLLLPQSYLMRFLCLARVGAVRAFALAKTGQTVEAMDQATKIIEFGDDLARAKGNILSLLVGVTVKNMGMATVRQLLVDTSPPPAFLWEEGRRLKAVSDNTEAFADGLRAEYEWSQGIIENLREGNLPDLAQNQDPFQQAQRRAWVRFACKRGILLKPNQTRRLFANTYRLWISDAPKSWSNMQMPEPPVSPEHSKISLLPGGNVLGKVFVSLLLPSGNSIMVTKCRANTEVAVTQTLVALKCFKVKTGRLPQTLQELVPEYLDAVPLDDFDGKPIRYSAQKMILYSVGKDLKDDGGFTKDEARAWWKKERPEASEDEEPDLWELPDPSFPIEF